MTVSKDHDQWKETEGLEVNVGKGESYPVLGWKVGLCEQLIEE